MTTLVTPREVIDLAFADGGYLPPKRSAPSISRRRKPAISSP